MNTRFTCLAMLLALALAGCGDAARHPDAGDPDPRPLYYRHPMDPSITSPTPAKDSMGMDYVPVHGAAREADAVLLSPALVHNLGVRTVALRHGHAGGGVRTTGLTAFDERRLAEVRVRTEGFVEQLAVRAPGEAVRRGQMLFAVYAPRLAAAQHEFLAAVRLGDEQLVAASVDRLRALGLGRSAIDVLRAGGEVQDRIRYYAPQDGVVMALGLREGGYAQPGAAALTLAGTDRLWVVAEIPQSQAAQVRTGQQAQIRFTMLPGRTFRSRVLEIVPVANERTLTVQARLELDNPAGTVASGMVADVLIESGDGGPAWWVPREALIRSGNGDRVIVALGEGRFAPRQVVTGREAGGEVEVLEGLDGSERVVVSGQFMIDSESQLQPALSRYGEDRPAEATPPAGEQPHEHHEGHGEGGT